MITKLESTLSFLLSIVLQKHVLSSFAKNLKSKPAACTAQSKIWSIYEHRTSLSCSSQSPTDDALCRLNVSDLFHFESEGKNILGIFFTF